MSIPLHVFLLAQYFYHMATSAIKTYIRPACVCMSIRLRISLAICLEVMLRANIGITLGRDLAVFTRSAITAPKVITELDEIWITLSTLFGAGRFHEISAQQRRSVSR